MNSYRLFQLMESLNTDPYEFNKDPKSTGMDIIFTFSEDNVHDFKVHFEKQVNLGRQVYRVMLGQKTPNLKAYKKIINKFHDPFKALATIVAIVKEFMKETPTMQGLGYGIPAKAFGTYSDLIGKVLHRNVPQLSTLDSQFQPPEYADDGLHYLWIIKNGHSVDSVFNGKYLKGKLEGSQDVDGSTDTLAPETADKSSKTPSGPQEGHFKGKNETFVVSTNDDGETFHTVYINNPKTGGIVSFNPYEKLDVANKVAQALSNMTLKFYDDTNEGIDFKNHSDLQKIYALAGEGTPTESLFFKPGTFVPVGTFVTDKNGETFKVVGHEVDEDGPYIVLLNKDNKKENAEVTWVRKASKTEQGKFVASLADATKAAAKLAAPKEPPLAPTPAQTNPVSATPGPVAQVAPKGLQGDALLKYYPVGSYIKMPADSNYRKLEVGIVKGVAQYDLKSLVITDPLNDMDKVQVNGDKIIKKLDGVDLKAYQDKTAQAAAAAQSALENIAKQYGLKPNPDSGNEQYSKEFKNGLVSSFWNVKAGRLGIQYDIVGKHTTPMEIYTSNKGMVIALNQMLQNIANQYKDYVVKLFLVTPPGPKIDPSEDEYSEYEQSIGGTVALDFSKGMPDKATPVAAKVEPVQMEPASAPASSSDATVQALEAYFKTEKKRKDLENFLKANPLQFTKEEKQVGFSGYSKAYIAKVGNYTMRIAFNKSTIYKKSGKLVTGSKVSTYISCYTRANDWEPSRSEVTMIDFGSASSSTAYPDHEKIDKNIDKMKVWAKKFMDLDDITLNY